MTETTPRDHLVKSLFETLTPEQEQVLRQTLTASQLAVVVEIAESLSKVGGGEKTSTVAGSAGFERIKEMERQVNEAADYFQGVLLPWAVGRLEKGEKLDPRLLSAEAAEHFGVLLKSLCAKDLAALVGESSPLGPAERKAFAQMAEAMKTASASGSAGGNDPGVPPQGTDTPSDKTK